MDMSSPAPSFNSLPSSRKGRCVQSSLQCLSPLHQYAMFLFGGHLPSAPPSPPPHTHTPARTPARTHAHTYTSPQRGPASERAGEFRVACSLSPFHQYTMFLFGGHLPSPPPPHTHLPNAAQLQKEQVRSEQHAVSPLHRSSVPGYLSRYAILFLFGGHLPL